jgi:hypothetical protein
MRKSSIVNLMAEARWQYTGEVRRCVAVLAMGLAPAWLWAGEGRAAELARRILQAGLDPQECYRVRELRFTKEDIRFYLTDGYLVFGKPVDGMRTSAVFTADVEGGDAEVLILPPHRSERLSLASYTGSPNLNEHFKSAVWIFTDDSYAQLWEQIRAYDPPRRSPEMGLLLAQSWDSVVQNFTSSFQIRVVGDILSARRPLNGFLYGALAGRKLGNFDVLFDPRAEEQVTVGHVAYRDNRPYFDVWTRFQARASRNQVRGTPEPEVALSDFRIDASIEPDLRLRVTTRAKMVPSAEGTRAPGFWVSHQMKASEARVDGEPAEVFPPESLRANLIRGGGNDGFLIVPPKELKAGRAYEIEFRHEGAVISDAGNGVYYVGARGSWYPSCGLQFARYDLTFRYPKDLGLVATGEVVEDRTESEWRITRRRTEPRVRLAGFNLGDYQQETVMRGDYKVEVYANRRLERALEPKPQPLIVLPPSTPLTPQSQRRAVELFRMTIEPPRPNPTARLEQLAFEVAGALEFMTTHFGPPPLKTLTVAPIPGRFGQGFPGLVYLSTLSYLEPSERPASARNEYQQTFFSEILSAHEVAHQWWGNVVTSASYRDDWLMEALANYSALLFLEKRKGGRVMESMLAEFKKHLLGKTEDGRVIETAGPIIWGVRLENSQVPGAWQTIVYEKGAWILHMLRGRIGDERFLAMLGELRRRYQYKAVTTEQFRQLAAQHLPPKSPDPDLEAFFDQWVYGTGIPSLKLNYSVRGKPPSVRVSGTVTQKDADEDFSVFVPVEVQLGRGKSVVQWVRTSSGAVPFSLTLRQLPTKVQLDPANSVLKR